MCPDPPGHQGVQEDKADDGKEDVEHGVEPEHVDMEVDRVGPELPGHQPGLSVGAGWPGGGGRAQARGHTGAGGGQLEKFGKVEGNGEENDWDYVVTGVDFVPENKSKNICT